MIVYNKIDLHKELHLKYTHMTMHIIENLKVSR